MNEFPRLIVDLASSKAANAAPTGAARRHLNVACLLASLLVRPGKKTRLPLGVLRGRGSGFLSRVGAFQLIFSYRFQQTLFRTLIHTAIIAQKKFNDGAHSAWTTSKRILSKQTNRLVVGQNGRVPVQMFFQLRLKEIHNS